MNMRPISSGPNVNFILSIFELSVQFESTTLITFLQHLLAVGVHSPEAAAALAEPNAHVRGIDALVLDAPIRWPLTIVYTSSTLTQYQIVFRRLLQCKTVMGMLTRCGARTPTANFLMQISHATQRSRAPRNHRRKCHRTRQTHANVSTPTVDSTKISGTLHNGRTVSCHAGIY
jgi:hypothetical protein